MLPRNTVTFLHGSRVPWAGGEGIRQGWGLLKLITTLRASEQHCDVHPPTAASSELPPRYWGVTICSTLSPRYWRMALPSSPEPWLSVSCSQTGQSHCMLLKKRLKTISKCCIFERKLFFNNKGPLRAQIAKSSPGEQSPAVTPKSFNTSKIFQHSYYCFQEHIHNTIQMPLLKTFHNKTKLTLGDNTKKIKLAFLIIFFLRGMVLTSFTLSRRNKTVTLQRECL